MRRLTEVVVANRPWLDRWLGIVAAVAPSLAVIAGLTHYAVTRDVAGVRFLALYVAPMFLAAPLWLRHRLVGFDQRSAVMHTIDAVVLALAVARFGFGEMLPFSGHMLFLTYTAITVNAAGYRWLAVVLLIETTIFKLILWRDPASWSVGLGLGAAAGIIAMMMQRRQ
ncbi:MAG: hypothetical protein ABIT20_13470 [Gemmatimonadaceae bacterium]